MTLFLVKWDDGTFALVNVEDEVALIDTLDQLGDPGAATWRVYDGPLWLEFPRIYESLPKDGDLDPDDIGIGRPSVADTDYGGAFADAVLGAVQPSLAALRERAIHEERAISRSEFEAAVQADQGCALPGTVYGEADWPEH